MSAPALPVRPEPAPASPQASRCACRHSVGTESGRCPRPATYRVMLRCLEVDCPIEVHRSLLCEACLDAWLPIAEVGGFAAQLTVTRL
ncbi:hypothetical protein [Nocardioides sp.]|uniref:hypothetical protein n=1 Tax=Nocardioides sp. TaxID=35761 RepID=UPI0026258763|nr:hypothetical protein [Nocardioides sp.]